MTVENGTDMAAREAEIDAKIEDLMARKAAAEKRVKELIASEDHKAGIFHAKAIFETQQEKLTLETELQFARREKRLLTLE